MATATAIRFPRELDARESDGVRVRLLWKGGDALSVEVADRRSGESFELLAGPRNALDVFRHPYAYRAP